MMNIKVKVSLDSEVLRKFLEKYLELLKNNPRNVVLFGVYAMGWPSFCDDDELFKTALRSSIANVRYILPYLTTDQIKQKTYPTYRDFLKDISNPIFGLELSELAKATCVANLLLLGELKDFESEYRDILSRFDKYIEDSFDYMKKVSCGMREVIEKQILNAPEILAAQDIKDLLDEVFISLTAVQNTSVTDDE